MRDTTRKLFKLPPDSVLPAKSAHAGLYLERCAPMPIEEGKLSHEQRKDFLGALCAIEVPTLYRDAFARWRVALAEDGAFVCEVEARSRLLVGHGNPSGAEVGLTLHPTYGVPYVPGSALKGLLNHWLAERGKLDDPGWKGVGYVEGRPAEAPGAFHGRLFGAPPVPQRDGVTNPLGDGLQGAVVFEDAWIIPDAPPHLPLALDVLTPHQKDYYRDFGAVAPDDWTSPIPVHFAAVKPKTRFLLAVSAVAGTSPSAARVAGIAMRHLLDALSLWGVGGKTAAGYGRLRTAAGAAPRRVLRPGAMATVAPSLKALREAVERVLRPAKAEEGTPVAERFQREFGDDTRLDPIGVPERPEALQALREVLAHPRLNKRYSARLAEIRRRFEGR